MKASKIVSSALLGFDGQTIFVNNKAYIITPPTIERIAGAAYYLSDINEGNNIADILKSLGKTDNAVHALSYFIQGNDSLFKALRKGTLNEIVQGLSVALSLISAENFLKLSALARNVAMLTAKER